jgi:molybdopterin converting factor small subunit
MFSLRIEMYGLPPGATSLRDINIDLNEGAVISDLVAAIKSAVPALDGEVIRKGENILTENYTFNINGHFFHNGGRLLLKAGDSVKLLSIATGG